MGFKPSDELEPGSSRPIGTLKELQKLGINTMRNASCSRPGPDNAGCTHYPCPLLREMQAKGIPTPQNVAYAVVKSNGNRKMDSMPCFDYMQNMAGMHPAIGTCEVLGYGGTGVAIKVRESDVDPANPRAVVKRLADYQVPAFPRPSDSQTDKMEAMEMRRHIARLRSDRIMGDMSELPTDDDAVVAPESETEVAEDMFDEPEPVRQMSKRVRRQAEAAEG